MQNAPSAEPGTWTPAHRSEIARHIWLTHASGRQTVWLGGFLSEASDADEDQAFLSAYHSFGTLPSSTPPDWIGELMSRLDALLPPQDELSECLDADSLTLPDSPPAFRFSAAPSPEDAGSCIAAARVLLSLRRDILPPVFMSEAEAVHLIQQASWAALMIGGEPAYLVASSILSDPATFAVRAAADDMDCIDTE